MGAEKIVMSDGKPVVWLFLYIRYLEERWQPSVFILKEGTLRCCWVQSSVSLITAVDVGCARSQRILPPQPGVEPTAPAVDAWGLSHWTAREVLVQFCYNLPGILGFMGSDYWEQIIVLQKFTNCRVTAKENQKTDSEWRRLAFNRRQGKNRDEMSWICFKFIGFHYHQTFINSLAIITLVLPCHSYTSL